MGGTGGESLLPLLDRGDPDNLDIGHGDQHQRAEQCHQSQGKIHHLQHLWPTADHLHQRRIVTEEVVDVGVTEWKLTGEDEGNEDEGEACQPAGEDELRADSAAQEDGVAEGPADGDVPVLGHGCEEEELCGPQVDVEKVLGDAASKANGLSSLGNVEKHLGHDDSLEPNFQAGQIPEEEVHRGLQEGVQQGQADDGQVSRDSDKVGKQQEQESCHLKLFSVCQALEGELSHHGLIGHCGFQVFSRNVQAWADRDIRH